MDMPIYSFVSLCIGLLVGAGVVWLILRARISATELRAKSESQVDIARFNERLIASQEDAKRLATQLADLQKQATLWRDQLDAAGDERAQLAERADRVPKLVVSLEGANQEISTLKQSIADIREKVGMVNSTIESQAEHIVQLQQERVALIERSDLLTRDVNLLNMQVSELTTALEAERKQSEEKLQLLIDAREQLSNQFKSLAGEILEDKSKRFTEQNQTNIGALLGPLKTQIHEFKAKVEDIHLKDTEQQATLKAELNQLKDLNRQITEEAHGLATALKGQSKMQGNWGEMVLENILDRSGLRSGKEYRREVSFNTETGKSRPDVIVYLPQVKHLVIDSKVSLNAYTRYVNAEGEIERQLALKEHVAAISSRIKELSDRNYFELPGLNSPEMVFMFIPIESAFVEALRADETLFQKAIEQNVLVATPTTLLTSLNIVRQLWRFEVQNAQTVELAKRAVMVHKKLCTFVCSMEGVGNQLDKAKDSYKIAMDQFTHGKGNLIQQVNDFKRLGVAVQGKFSEDLLAKAGLELEFLPELPAQENVPLE
ncbi:DNA recombination protein RmuC [Candidatus Nitrotoga arctica]|uniref:DNA recombination protein RmuC n=1 Tax=Candidatus Nitrotoga arctica TaxID=453162 RepID=A0ABN8AII0_9PROT|nr:DNA recombination protein RmuC [Candidatus Nitrotoga arctica]CAG9932535.1 DNA recombination protein RmuC [Candidatus Nitrotoga arctica]